MADRDVIRPADPRTGDQALIDGHHMARGAAVNTLVLIASNFRALFVLLIARLLGAAALGRFSVVFAATDLLSKPALLGLDTAVVPLVAKRAAAGDLAGCRAVFQTSVRLAAAAALAIAALSIAVIVAAGERWGLDAFAGGGVVMLLALPGIAVARVSASVSRGLLSMKNEFYSRGMAETWVTTGTFVVAMAVGLRDVAPAIAVVAGSTAAAGVAFVLASRSLDRAASSASNFRGATSDDAVSPASLLRFSLPIAGSNLLAVLMTQSDVLLLGFYVGRAPGVTLETVGIFAVAAQLAVGLRKVRQVFDPIFAPVAASRVATANRAALRDTVGGPGRWVLAAQLPLVGALVLAGGAVLSIYGPAYRSGALWLAMLAVAHGTNTFAGLVETLLMIERPGLNLLNGVITVAVQVVFGVVLIPRFGVTGAAVAMCAGFVVQSVLRFVEVRHVYGWTWPWRTLQRPIVAFTVAFVPAALLRILRPGRIEELLAGGLFLGLYFVAWRILGADPADKAVWRKLRGLDSVSGPASQ